MDINSSQVDQIKELKTQIQNERSDLLQLAQSLKLLENILEEEGDGITLEPLYEKVPDNLKGFVELVYDLQNNPSFRVYEPLLYNSEYYKEELQSIALWVTNDDERPFVLSTPRIDSPNVLHLQIPFSHPGIDYISKMKRMSGEISEAARLLNIPENKMSLFESLFTPEEPPKYRPYEGDKVRMRYFGHACVLVETKDVSILIDPVVSYYGYQNEIDRFSDLDLPEKIDYVLITHNHQDHILFETLLPLRHKIGNIVVPRTTSGALQDPNLRLMFERTGFGNIIEIEDFQDIVFSDCTITGLPFIGEHCDLNIQTKICYKVQFEDFSMLFAADSCNIEPEIYKRVHQLVSDVDVMFLGMECDGAPLSWLYGPLLNGELPRDYDQSRRLKGSNFAQARSMVDIFNPLEVYVYAMGQEPWLEFISSIKYTPESHPIVQSNMLVDYCHKKGMTAERLFGEKEILYKKHIDQQNRTSSNQTVSDLNGQLLYSNE